MGEFLNVRDFGAVGSRFVSKAYSEAGSNVLNLDDVGDFQAGEEVLVTQCQIHYPGRYLFERRNRDTSVNRPYVHNQPLLDRVELEGYDGSQGDWVVYIIDMCPEMPDIFRWTKNFGQDWIDNVPLTKGWIALGDGVRIKINDFKEREWGCTAAIVCSARFVTTIKSVAGNKVFLTEPVNRTCKCEIMHSDNAVLQKAIDAAIAQKTSLFLPNGKYRLTRSLDIMNASGFALIGESGTDTIIENSLGALGVETEHGSTFYINGGNDVTLKNLFMVGSLGFEDREKGANLMCRGGTSVFGFYFHKSNATCVVNTKRVLIENCHARKMSGECFYSMGDSRENADPPDNYTREITYLRCSVEDCCRNAFNNNDNAEGTSILYCRVKNVGNCMNEGASRFIKIHGCYASNCGWIATGNVRRRGHLDKLGAAQHIITDNYFEGRTVRPHEPMIKIGSYTSQVTIANNIFVNFASPAIEVFGVGQSCDTPPENVIIKGNSIDLTAVDDENRKRYGIRITSSFVMVADNHIFVRGVANPNVTGIELSDDAVKVLLHDNTISGCGIGIRSEFVEGEIGTVLSDTVFYRGEISSQCKPMLLRRDSHRYRGWRLMWLEDKTESEIADFDPIELHFTLKQPRKGLKKGDRFRIYGPHALPWLIHHNILDECTTPMLLDTYGGNRAVKESNLIG